MKSRSRRSVDEMFRISPEEFANHPALLSGKAFAKDHLLRDIEEAARSILPLTARPKSSLMPAKKPVHAQPDPDRVILHLPVRALVSLGAVDACLEALDGLLTED